VSTTPISPARPRNGSVRTRFGEPSVLWSLGRRREAGSILRGLSYYSRESVETESRVGTNQYIALLSLAGVIAVSSIFTA
jgi:hypothetical protein